MYVLDEPTTGLHFADVEKLLGVINGLVDKGNTVIVIEHNLDVIKASDWLIDMGPEGGSGGGQVVAIGTPEDIADNPDSHTGTFLKPILAGRAARQSAPVRRAASGAKTPAKAAVSRAKAVPAKAVTAKAALAKAVPAKAVPAKAVPAKALPAKAAPAKPAVAKAAPAKAAPAKAAPVTAGVNGANGDAATAAKAGAARARSRAAKLI